MNEELDSQLSAMFDDELPAAECELLARRLSRDAQLQARWGRYAVVGAAIRAEHGVRLNVMLAQKVSSRVVAEPALSAAGVAAMGRSRVRQWWQPVAGAAVAAGVAAVCVSWLRTSIPANTPLAARSSGPAAVTRPVMAATAAGGGTAVSYVVPPRQMQVPLAVPSTELANYVVAHSMYSAPVTRRNLLSAFVTGEGGASVMEEPPAASLAGSDAPGPAPAAVGR